MMFQLTIQLAIVHELTEFPLKPGASRCCLFSESFHHLIVALSDESRILTLAFVVFVKESFKMCDWRGIALVFWLPYRKHVVMLQHLQRSKFQNYRSE